MTLVKIRKKQYIYFFFKLKLFFYKLTFLLSFAKKLFFLLLTIFLIIIFLKISFQWLTENNFFYFLFLLIRKLFEKEKIMQIKVIYSN